MGHVNGDKEFPLSLRTTFLFILSGGFLLFQFVLGICELFKNESIPLVNHIMQIFNVLSISTCVIGVFASAPGSFTTNDLLAGLLAGKFMKATHGQGITQFDANCAGAGEECSDKQCCPGLRCHTTPFNQVRHHYPIEHHSANQMLVGLYWGKLSSSAFIKVGT